MAHLFVSYVRSAKAAVDRLLGDLHAAGHTTWYDQRSIQVGEHWQLSIRRGIADADLVLLAISPAARSSKWVARELEIAREQHKPILPVVVMPTPSREYPECVSEGHLQAVKLATDYAGGLAKLLGDLRGVPGSGARIPFVVDFVRLQQFVGRDEDLRELHRMLSTPGTTGVTPVGLAGMGGIGKTQLAVEYAYRYRYFYPDGVFMIDGGADWSAEFERLGRQIHEADGAKAERGTGTDPAALALLYLTSHDRVLLILDNVSRAAEISNRRLVDGSTLHRLSCRVLFSTRQRFDLRALRSFEVKLLSPGLAREILVRDRPVLSKDPATGDVCEALGYLPLALDLGASFFRKKPRATPTTYLQYLRQNGADATHAQARLGADDLEAYYSATLRPALRVQWALLSDPNAALVVGCCSFHAPNARVPIGRLAFLTGLWDSPNGVVTPLADAIADAYGASLIEVLDHGLVRLHPLILDAIRHPTDDDPLEVRELLVEPARLTACHSFARSMRDLFYIESCLAERGVQELELDLRFVVELARALADSGGTDLELAKALEVFRRQSHILIGWASAQDPAQLAQQLLYQSTVSDAPLLAEAAEHRLRALDVPYLRLDWRMPPDTGSLERILVGHQGTVRSIELDGTADLAATASLDGTVRLWNLASGYQTFALTNHGDGATAVAIMPGGEQIVTGARDGWIRIWDRSSGEVQREIRGHDGEVRMLVPMPDGRRVASGGADGMVKVWSVESGLCVREMSAHHSINPWNKEKVGVRWIFVAATGDRLVSAGNSTIKRWDLNTGQLLSAARTESMTSVAVTPDCARAVVGRYDVPYPVEFWDLESGAKFASDDAMFGPKVDEVVMMKDGRLAFCSTNWDQRIFVYDVASGYNLGFLKARTGVTALALSEQNELISIAGGRIEIWDAESGTWLRDLDGYVVPDYSLIAFDPKGRYAITAEQFSTELRVWDLTVSPVARPGLRHEGIVASIVVSPDGRKVISMATDDTVIERDVSTGEPVVAASGMRLTTLAFVAGGASIVGGAVDGRLFVWDSTSGAAVQHFRSHGDSHAKQSADPMIREVWARAGETAKVTDFKVTPDGTRLVSASNDCTIRVWDLASGALIHVLAGHDDSVEVLAIAAAGDRIASSSADGTTRLWDLHSGEEICRFPIPPGIESGWCRHLAFSRDDSRLLGDPHRSLVSWTVRDGTIDRVFETAETTTLSNIRSLEWSTDDRRVLCAKTRVQVFDYESTRLLATLGSWPGKTSYGMTCFTTFRGGDRCLSAWVTLRVLEVWNVASATVCRSLDTGTEVTAVAVSPDETTILIGDRAGTIYKFVYVEPAPT